MNYQPFAFIKKKPGKCSTTKIEICYKSKKKIVNWNKRYWNVRYKQIQKLDKYRFVFKFYISECLHEGFFWTVKVTHSVISKTGDSFIYMQGLYIRFDVIMTLFCLPIIYLLEHCVCQEFFMWCKIKNIYPINMCITMSSKIRVGFNTLNVPYIW